jgi:hypothetical protein
VILRGDGEFVGWDSVGAAIKEGYDCIFGDKACVRRLSRRSGIKLGRKI